MMINATMDNLSKLRMFGMIRALEEQRKLPDCFGLDFDQRLGMIVDREVMERENRRYKRKMLDAKLKESSATIEDINWQRHRGLEKSVMMSLATCDWIREKQNIIFTGPTGTGKTWLSCALANRACLLGYSSHFIRVPRLFNALAAAKADGSLPKLMNSYAKFDLMILDDWGQPLTESQRRDLLEIIDDKNGAGSLIITSQLPVKHWHEVIGDPSLADAILDRVIHRSHKIELDGDSLRNPLEGLAAKPATSRKHQG